MNNKKGNIVLAIFPFFAILFIVVMFVIIIIYSQIITGVVSIKSDLFYIVQNSIIKLSKDDLSYGEYILDNNQLKNEIINLIEKSYMLDKNGNKITRSSGVIKIVVNEVEYYTKEVEVLEHTSGKYKEPIVHIVITVTTKTVLNIGTKDTYETIIHEDIKLSRMKMF